MRRLAAFALGMVSAVGGFVDMGGIITATQAGAVYRFSLIWTIIFGIVGLVVFSDMAGRVAIDSGRTMYDVIRDRLGFRLALIPVVSTVVVHVLTLVVELAGMALALQIASRLSYLIWFPIVALLLGIMLWKFSFNLLDNLAALMGLAMLVTVAAMIKLAPPWHEVVTSFVHPSMRTAHPLPAYLFAAVSLLGAYMTPYQFNFYSSGALEEGWDAGDQRLSQIVISAGSLFGSVIVVALMVTAAQVLFPLHSSAGSLADAALPSKSSLGEIGLVLFLIGVFSVSMGAGLEVLLSGADPLCQYFGWDWGKKGKPRDAPVFSLIYLVMLVLAVLIALSGVNPINLTVITMAAAAVALPLNFVPLLLVANDPEYVGGQTNGLLMNIAAVLVLVLLCLVALSAIPLFIVSNF